MPHRIAAANPAFEAATYRKITWRLLPILFLCYVASYLDRVNVGFAKLQMLSDLKFSDTVYGLGAGIFFLGYFIFEIPSNMMLHRVGARLWIARIMITWAMASAAMVFVTNATTFYVMRFLLGAAEAGFFPGVILYLTYWFPASRRGKIIALFMTGVPISGVIGGPVSGWVVQITSGLHGLAGWQWMFLLEAIPSLLLGVVVVFYLQDGIRQAHWLSPAEQDFLENQLAADGSAKTEATLRQVLGNTRVWLMALIYFCLVMGLYGVSFWLPTLIGAAGVKDPVSVGLLTAIPYGAAAVAMIITGQSADKHRERRWHIVVPALLGSLGLMLSTLFAHNVVLAMVALTLATAGIITALPLFWSLPTAFLGGAAAAAGIALINSLGNLAGFVSPYMVGWLKDQTHSTNSGMFVLAVSLIVGALLTLRAVEINNYPKYLWLCS